jgi:hypothetical protein
MELLDRTFAGTAILGVVPLPPSRSALARALSEYWDTGGAAMTVGGVTGGLALAGIFLAPFTGGLSLLVTISAGFALGGSIVAVGVGASAQTLYRTGAISRERAMEVQSAGLLTLDASSPGAILAASGAAVASGGDPDTVEEAIFWGGLAEGVALGVYEPAKLAANRGGFLYQKLIVNPLRVTEEGAHGRMLARQAWLEASDVGQNVTKEASFNRWPEIGERVTYVTDEQAVVEILGGVAQNQRMNVTLFGIGGENTVSAWRAGRLESALGLRPGEMRGGFRYSRIDRLAARRPEQASFATGNPYVRPGEGLPGGGPELALRNRVPTTPWPIAGPDNTPRGLSRDWWTEPGFRPTVIRIGATIFEIPRSATHGTR